MIKTVDISGKSFTFNTQWDGQVLSGHTIALDTETVLINEESPWEVPDIVIISVSNGVENFLIHPSKLEHFLDLHKDKHYVMFNCAFDFWVMCKFLDARQKKNPLWDIVDQNRLHDLMLLDALYRLAENDDYPAPRNLGVVAKRYCQMDIDKDDPYRLRYGEIVGKDIDAVEPGFADYAIKDTIATYFAFINCFKHCKKLAMDYGISKETIEKYGIFTENLQVKAAVALSNITNRGIKLDVNFSNNLHNKIQEEVNELSTTIHELYPNLFKRHKKTGEIDYTKNGAPRKNLKVLRDIFTSVAADITQEKGTEVKIPKTDKGAVSTSMVDWGDYITSSNFLTLWDSFIEKTKLLEFFGKLQVEEIHPRYNYFVRTGRTSQQSPNCQQIPSSGDMRRIIVPRPGYLICSIDYSFIELRTLAAVFEKLFKKSVLADVIREGKDPHAFTGGLFIGMEYDEFLSLKEKDEKKFSKWRQNAKACNFGIPGGLSAGALLSYAKNIYKIKDWTFDDAKHLRDKLCYQVYPELGKYLEEDSMFIMAQNLDCSIEDAWDEFAIKGERNPGILASIRNIVGGKQKRTGGVYSEYYVKSVWEKLNKLNRNPSLYKHLKNREVGLETSKKLFWTHVTTLTGRVRGRVSFTQARNSPFQGLAADGAKLALWRLVKEGYRIINFVHDEINFEIPEHGDGWADKKEVEYLLKTMCEEMGKVTFGIPIKGEYSVTRDWRKKSKFREEGDRIYPIV
jgi:DNA polymerase I-like protein with 3'-5' exonuclease and polymerase domains